MTKNNYIIKKTYVAPSVAFEAIEEEQEMLAGTYTDAGGSHEDGEPGFGDDAGAKPTTGGITEGGAKEAYDFVFEYE